MFLLLDICWTMCHCVMVLHLIGLTFDVSDSVKTPEVLGISDNRPVLIPNLLEVFSFAYYPPCVIIGPQFSFKRYMSMLDKKFEGTKNMSAGLKRFATGVCYLAVYQGLTILIPDGYFLTEEFLAKNYFMRVFLLSIWGHKTLYKYISCWILSEGAAMCCGELYFDLRFIQLCSNILLLSSSGVSFFSRRHRTHICFARRKDWRRGLVGMCQHQVTHIREHIPLSRLHLSFQCPDKLVGFPVRVQTSQIPQQ